jgi:hypothetical protein
MIGGDHLTLGKTRNHIERAAKLDITRLTTGQIILNLAKRLASSLAIGNKGRKFMRLQTKGGIGSAIGPGQGKVLFDHAGSKGYSRDRGRCARRMIRQAGHHAKPLG